MKVSSIIHTFHIIILMKIVREKVCSLFCTLTVQVLFIMYSILIPSQETQFLILSHSPSFTHEFKEVSTKFNYGWLLFSHCSNQSLYLNGWHKLETTLLSGLPTELAKNGQGVRIRGSVWNRFSLPNIQSSLLREESAILKSS